jgi:hypothetical protein|tara:strand:- start:8199 stop:8417 length:219 start_codon:yes stop_codon:yes gene_type:complete
MHLHPDSVQRVTDLAKRNEYNYFFDNMKNKDERPPEDLLEGIALVFMKEFNIKHNEQEKVEFFISLGYYMHK